MQEALDDNDSSLVWKLAKLIGNKWGRGKAAACVLSPEDWELGMSHAGTLGGCQASSLEHWGRWALAMEEERLDQSGLCHAFDFIQHWCPPARLVFLRRM